MSGFEIVPIKHLPDSFTARHPRAAHIGDGAASAFRAACAFFAPHDVLTHKILRCKYFVASGRVICEDAWA